MGSTSELCSCIRDSEYWDSIRNGFDEQSARDGDEELVPNANDSSSDISMCVNEKEVPKVFPKRTQTTKSEGTSTQVMLSYEKKETTSSFFNKIMENAKSILSMKCSVIHPSAPLNEEPTKDTEETCACDTWPTNTERASPYDTCIDKSRSESCFCEDKTTDNSYSQEFSAGSNSCSCCRTPTSGTPKFFKAADVAPDPLVNDKSDKQIQFAAQKCSRACSCARSTVSDQVQTVPLPRRELASCACVTSSTLANCPRRKGEKVSAQQQYSREDMSVKCTNGATNTSRQATDVWSEQPKAPSNMGKSASEASKPNKSPNNAQKRKSCNVSNCPAAKRVRSKSSVRDIRHENNQCAFVGSPSLKPTIVAQQAKVSANTPITKNFSCCCNNTNSTQLMQMLSDLASQEKGIKNQLNDLIEREKNYDAMLSNLQRNTNSEKPCCCKNNHGQSPKSDFETVSQELRMENCRLKSDLMEMKLELKHCLEKVEGPMKAKLEAEKAKCICLQNELSKASQNMVVNQDMYEREMNSLKLQLCIACSNMTELNGINKRLQDELSSLDCLCAKLEEDLMKQKLSEAETIRRLKKRCPDTEEKLKQRPEETTPSKETFKCDSNLHVIARKLSKTLKESAPCDECSKLPDELTSAARCIRDLTDMVESRKVSKPDGDGLKKDSFSQSLPRTETVCCQCTELRDIGAGESVATSAVQHKVDVTTVFSAPPKAFLEGQESAPGVQLPATASGAGPIDATKSHYFDARGDPTHPVPPESNLSVEPCSEPCLHEDAACDPMGRPCGKTADATIQKSPAPVGEVQVSAPPRGEVLKSATPSQAKPPPCPPSCYVDGVPCPRQINAGVAAVPAKPTGSSTEMVVTETIDDVLRIADEVHQARQSKVSGAGDKVELPEETPGQASGEATEIVEDVKPEKVSLREGPQVEEPSKPYESAKSSTGAGSPASAKPSAGLEPTASAKASAGIEAPASAQPSAGTEPPVSAKPSAGTEAPASAKSSTSSKPSMSAKPSETAKSSGEPAGAAPPRESVPFTIVEEDEGNFPFAVTTRGEVLSEPPAGLNVTTVITTSGNLEVITEGPQGLIETTLNYNEEDGTIEVITEISEIPKESESPSRPSSAITEMSKTRSALSKKSDVRSEDARVTFEGQKHELATPAVEQESMVSGKETEQSISAAMSTQPSTTVSASESSRGTPSTGQDETTTSATSQIPGTFPGSPSTQRGEAAPDQKDSQMNDRQKTSTEVDAVAAQASRGERVPSEIGSKSSKLESTQSDTFPKSTGSELTSTEISTATEKFSQRDQSEVTETGGYSKSTGSEMTPSIKPDAENGSGLETASQKDSHVQDRSETILTTNLEAIPSAEPIKQTPSAQKEPEIAEVPKGEEVPTSGADGPETETRKAVSKGEGLPEGASAKTSAVADRASKKSVPEQCAEQPLKGQKRDCACQSTPQTEQSCQCCECKDVGVPSSQDTETITEGKMTYEKLPPDASEHAPPAQFQQPYPPRDSQGVAEGQPIEVKGKISKDVSQASAVRDETRGEPKSTDSSVTGKASSGAEGVVPAIPSQANRGAESVVPTIQSQASRGVEGVVPAVRSQASRSAEGVVPAVGSQASRGAEGVVPAIQSQASRGAEGVVPAVGSQASRGAEGVVPAVRSPASSGAEDVYSTIRSAASREVNVTDSAIKQQASRGADDVNSAIKERASKGAKDTGSTVKFQEGKDVEGVRSQASRGVEEVDSTIRERASKEAKVTHQGIESQTGRGVEGVRSQASRGVDSAAAITEPKGADSGIRERPSKGPAGVDSTVRAGKDVSATSSAVGDQTKAARMAKGSEIAAQRSRDSAGIKDQVGKDSAAKMEAVSSAADGAIMSPDQAMMDEENAQLEEVDEFDDALGPTTVTVSSGRDEQEKVSAETATATAEPISKGVQKSSEGEIPTDEEVSEPQDGSETRFMDAGTSDQSPSRPSTRSDGDGPRKTDVSEPLEEFVSAQEVLEEGEPEAAAAPTPVSSKGSKKEAKLKRSSEVPDSVSKLSDKVMPPVRSDGSDPKRPKKKRSPKFDAFTCECHGVCNCTICSPEIISRRIELTGSPYPAEGISGEICCCAGRPAPPAPDCKKPCPAQVYLQTQAAKRPTACAARHQPATEALLRSTNLDVSESKSKKRISIDDVFGQKKCDAETSCRATPRKKAAGCPGCVPRECQVDCVPAPKSNTDCQTDVPGTSAGPRLSPLERQSHPPNCECVDCLCFPKIQELAQTVEFPIVKDDKQVYQVSSMKCSCVNAQNAKKLLERTKIPLPTTSSGRPPKIKISAVPSANCDCDVCACTPCLDPKKASVPAKPSRDQRSQQPSGVNVDLSKLCDCQDCKCERCFDKLPKAESKPQTKSNKNCCCPGECSCPVCPTETLQKQLEEEKSKAAQMAQMSNKPSAVSKAVSGVSKAVSGVSKQVSGVSKQVSQAPHPEDCDCPLCACPNAPPKVPPTPSKTEKEIKMVSYDHPDDCDCPLCACPGSESKKPETAPLPTPPQPEAAAPPSADHPEGCTCPECVGCPKSPAKKPPAEVTPKPSEAAKGRPPDCDCGDTCSCPGGPSPGARGDQLPPKVSQHKPTCDCATCKCGPCPDKEKMPQPQTTDAGGRAIAACDCPGVCACAPCADPSKQKQQPVVSAKPSTRSEKPTPGVCDCGTCTCATKDSVVSVQKPPVTPHSVGCTCDICECPNKDKVKEQAEQTVREVEHPLDCDCQECECFTTQFCDARVGTTETKSTHTDQPECDCEKCVCPHLEGGIDVGVSIKENKETHPKDCDCQECQCADVPPTEGAAPRTLKGDEKGCCCPDCKCFDCYKLKDTSAHTLECKCGECLCKDCPKEMGPKGRTISAAPSKKSARVEGAADGGPSCPCGDCKCVDCYGKLGRAPAVTRCTCAPCLCVDCRFDHGTAGKVEAASKAGIEAGKITATASVAPADEAAIKSRSCHCVGCECDVCSNEDRQKPRTTEKEIVAKASMANKSCHCVTCVCKDCIDAAMRTAASAARSAPKKGEGECACSTCTCKDCAAKKGQGEEKKSEARVDREQSKEIGSSKERACKCLSCICYDCKSKPGGQSGKMEAKISERKGVTPSQSRNAGKEANCKCVTCTCSKCQPPTGAPAVGPATCHCETCQCEDCKYKKTLGQAGAISAHASRASPQDGAEHAPTCKCAICECYRSAYTGDEQVIAKVDFKQSEMSSKQSKGPSAKQSRQTAPASAKPSERLNTSESSHKPSHPETQFTDPPPFEVPQKMPCDCRTCSCVVCREQVATTMARFGFEPGRSDAEAPPFEVPVRMPCICETCTCPTCVKEVRQPPPQPSVPQHVDVHRPLPLSAVSSKQPQTPGVRSAGQQPPTSAAVSFHEPNVTDYQQQPSAATVPPPQLSAPGSAQPSHLSAPGGSRQPSAAVSAHQSQPQIPESKSATVEKNRPVSAPPGSRSERPCNCATCTCPDPSAAAPNVPPSQSNAQPGDVGSMKSSKHSRKTEGSTHPQDCICDKCNCASDLIEVVDISTLDDDSLKKKIETGRQENCECREQIKEIKKALNRIKCACNEAEVKAYKSKPLVKQASAFGQTMSGLKLALSNLQEKCKAKDKMIEAMTGELKTRTSSNTLEKVLNTPIPEAPDYDKAEDVKTLPNAHGEPMTNVLYSANDDKTLDSKISKAMETEKAYKNKSSKKPCRCGKPHKVKDNQNVNLAGFEVTDIRRITQDSIIIKWRPPKSNLVNGYDIFVNGVNKSKVMSGGRTSAMIHSLDLTATIQITIYAVTKCGRCEPPAIAIYEIR